MALIVNLQIDRDLKKVKRFKIGGPGANIFDKIAFYTLALKSYNFFVSTDFDET